MTGRNIVSKDVVKAMAMWLTKTQKAIERASKVGMSRLIGK
jgi:hypothetical protein